MSKGKVREAMHIPSHSRLEAEVPPSLSFPHPSSRSKELVMDEPWNLGLSQRGNCSQIRKKGNELLEKKDKYLLCSTA